MDKIKKILLMENKVFEWIHVGTLVIIFIISIILSIEIYWNVRHKIENEEPLNNIEIIEDNDTDETQSKTYEDEEVLINPGKGWILYNNKETDKYNDVISVGYTRVDWSDIEEEEGIYNWSIIDSRIENYARKGKKYSFGVLCASSSSDKEYVTPKWVFDAGAEYYTYNNQEKGIIQKIPVWTDKIFLEKQNNFIKALSERYDGNENIAFIDIRSYGNFGEQHLGTIGGKYLTSDELQELYLKPYSETFSKTLLVSPCGESRYNSAYSWGIGHGISLRRDGIFKWSDGSECLMAYGKLPTVFEYTADYNWMKKNNYWSTENLLQYVKNGKPSYIQFDPQMYKENKEFCDMLANKMGYYFKFKEAKFKNKVSSQEEEKIQLKFVNEGVSPLYEDCTVYIGLLDSEYNLVKKYKTDINPKTWMPNDEIQEETNLKLNYVEDGKYIISVGLFLNENDENPTYLLGNSGKTKNKWYVFGEVSIENPTEEYIIDLEKEQNIINNYNSSYNVKVTAKNLREIYSYKINVYSNNVLIQTLNIDNNQEEYMQNIGIDLNDGENNYKINIEKNGEIVYRFEKNIYVCNVVDNNMEIARNINAGYKTLKAQYAKEIEKIPNLLNKINQMENYMNSVEKYSGKILDSAAIKATQTHYELGNIILQECIKNYSIINLEQINKLLIEIDNIGNYYKDLLVISTSDLKNLQLDETEKIIENINNIIDKNSEIDMTFLTKILEKINGDYERACYINNLEEQNDIKAGLIISNNLHAQLLADWANKFASIQINNNINEYIAQNPVTIEYSETNITNKSVKATIKTNAEIQITNNSNSKEYVFDQNGSFTFEYTIKGQAKQITAKVTNIDKTLPIINGVIDGKLYTSKITPTITDENIDTIKLILNGEEVKNFKSVTTLIEEGFYTLTAIDKAGNKTQISFQIMENNNQNYIIQDNIIKNISEQTIKSDFDNKLKLGITYKITRNEKEITSTDNIATGDILTTSAGDKYTLIVTGDLNKDGKLNLKDLVKMRKYFLDGNNLDENEILAADCNFDGKINLKDLVKMRLMLLNQDATK